MAKKASAVHKPLPQDITLGALLIVLLASAFLIVLPRLHALRALPQHYYNLLPVATQTGDIDRDGIPDNIDPTPYGHREEGIGRNINNVAEEEVVEEAAAEDDASEHAAAPEGE